MCRGTIVDGVGRHVEARGEHAAANVASDRVGIDSPPGGEDGSDTDVVGEVDVGHDRHVDDVGRGADAVQRLGDLPRKASLGELRERRRHGTTSKTSSGVRFL